MNHNLPQEGWSNSKGFKAFSLMEKDTLFPYEHGIDQGWDKPFAKKLENPMTYGMLEQTEDDILRGIQQMMDDEKRHKNERGG